MKANEETVAALSKKLEQLNDIIMNVVKKVESRASSRQMNSQETAEMWEDLQATDGWRERVDQLKELVPVAGNLSKCVD